VRRNARIHVAKTLPVLLLVLVQTGITDAAEHAAFRAALATITDEDLAQHVGTLADDVFEGREAGSRGGHASATYLRKELEKLAVEPAGPDGQWFQTFGDNYRNLLAMVSGSDPKLKNEFILLTAHYDHVGYGSRSNSYGPVGFIHNGADDNASGVSALLELIQAILALPQPPGRSILFMLWDGEEKGLLGSRHWIENPTVPLETIRLLINLDMIGRLRDDRLEVFGTRTAQGLRRLVARVNSQQPIDSAQTLLPGTPLLAGGLLLDFQWDVRANSDHWPFFEHDIPFLQYHTGLHDDYHRPSDDTHLINTAGMRRVTQLLFATVVAVADAKELPDFRQAARHESQGDRHRFERQLPTLPPRLGVTWDPKTDAAGAGVVINHVVYDTPAHRAQLQTGDRIVAIDGQPIHSGNQFRAAVLIASGETTLTIERLDNKTPVDIKVSLPKNPVRVGISWREEEAEPGVVLITRVIAGSPAATAALRTGDRIYQLNGHDFSGSDDLLEQLATVDNDLTLNVERRGRLRNVELHLPTIPDEPHPVETRPTAPRPG